MINAKDRLTGKYRLDPRFHKQMCKQFQTEKDQLGLYPRNHLKSTFVKKRIVQRILQNPNNRQSLWSRNSRLVRKELRDIKIMLKNPKLVAAFPEILPHDDKGRLLPENDWQKSDQDGFTIRHVEEYGFIGQEEQVEAWGIESTVTGHHYDYHYYDDVINERSITTTDQIEKVRDWWRRAQDIKELAGIELMIGTRYHHLDIYGEIIHEKHYPIVTVRKAIEAGKPIYSFYTLSDYQKIKRRRGAYIWATQWMNEPVPEEDRIFVPPYPEYDELPKEEMKWYIGVDPAFTATQYSNLTGLAVAAVPANRPNRIYFERNYGVKMKSDKLAQHIVDLIVQYRPRRIGIESTLYDPLKYLIELLLKDYALQNKDIVRPVFVRISQGKEKKAIKLSNALGAFVRTGRAMFKKSDEMKQMYSQMTLFNPRSDANEDDLLDAANMVIQAVENFAQGHWAKVTIEEPSGISVETLLKRNKVNEEVWDKQFA